MTFSCDFSVLRISGMMLEGLNSEHVILYMHVLLVGHGQPAGTRYPCGHGYGQKPVPGCGYGFLSEQVSFSRARVWERDTQRVHARCHLYPNLTIDDSLSRTHMCGAVVRDSLSGPTMAPRLLDRARGLHGRRNTLVRGEFLNKVAKPHRIVDQLRQRSTVSENPPRRLVIPTSRRAF